MCTIINCSKENSSLLLSKRGQPPCQTSEKFKTPPVCKNMSSKSLGKKKAEYILDLYILEPTTICWQGQSYSKVLRQLRFLCTHVSATGCCLQSANSTVEDLGQQQELSAGIEPLYCEQIWGGGEAQIFVLLLKSDIINFVPHLYFHCLMGHHQQCARNAHIA